MRPGRVGVAILAAGGSQRMGRPKQLLPFRERTLLHHAVEVAVASVCRPIVVVIGANAELIRGGLQPLPVTIAENLHWEMGIASSLRVAIETLRAFDGLDGIVITLADLPLLTPDAVNLLVETHYHTGKDIVASEYAETYGVPLFIAKRLFDELAVLEGNQGAKHVIARHLEEMTTVPIADAAFDIDTPADYAQLIGTSRT
jgi:molybdenum cofactor cytidylyltransferase